MTNGLPAELNYSQKLILFVSFYISWGFLSSAFPLRLVSLYLCKNIVALLKHGNMDKSLSESQELKLPNLGFAQAVVEKINYCPVNSFELHGNACKLPSCYHMGQNPGPQCYSYNACVDLETFTSTSVTAQLSEVLTWSNIVRLSACIPLYVHRQKLVLVVKNEF